MPNPYGAEEISAADAALQMENEASWILDVREEMEFRRARIKHSRVIEVPLSKLASEGPDSLPAELSKDAPVIVMCHHGIRSAQVTVWLSNQGWSNVLNMAGGIAAYANDVDSSVGQY
ncbi:MAG: rhodanese-like domain-containing protein [Calditrichia bacterium]